MEKRELIAKKALYEAKKEELLLETNEEEISALVNDFRLKKEQEIIEFEKAQREAFANKKAAAETKLDNYLELLNELIEEAEIRERQIQNDAEHIDNDEDLA